MVNFIKLLIKKLTNILRYIENNRIILKSKKKKLIIMEKFLMKNII